MLKGIQAFTHLYSHLAALASTSEVMRCVRVSVPPVVATDIAQCRANVRAIQTMEVTFAMFACLAGQVSTALLLYAATLACMEAATNSPVHVFVMMAGRM